MTLELLEPVPLHATLRRMEIPRATDLWLGELERQGDSPRTIATYRTILDALADSYPRVDVDELTTTMLRRFLDKHRTRRDGQRKADATIAQTITVLNTWADWLTSEGLVRSNPTRRNGLRILMRPRLAPPEENDNVKTVSSADVARLLDAADRSGHWNQRLAVYALAYLGPRRRAIARVRLSDYDQIERTLRFLEKGNRTIEKPVPDRLADLLDAAIHSGLYTSPDDYLIPGDAEQRRTGERDDRIILRLVRKVAAAAGITAHAHALRAAFAVLFLEQKPGELVALQKLMGHRRIETTIVYLRRLNRRQAMETVRDLDWCAICEKSVAAKPVTEKEGFEPSFGAQPGAARADSERTKNPLGEDLLERARQARDAERETA